MNKKSREKKSRIMNLIIRDMASRDWKIWIENFWLEEGVRLRGGGYQCGTR